MAWISFGALPCRKKKLDDSSRLDVVEIARVPDMLPSLFPSCSGLRTYQHSGNILPVFAIKAYRGTRCIDPFIFNYGRRRSEWKLHVPAVFTLGKNLLYTEQEMGRNPVSSWTSFFQYQAWKKNYYLATGCNTNTIKTLFILDIRGTIETRWTLPASTPLKPCTRKNCGKLHPLADSCNVYKLATEFSFPCHFPLPMLNSTAIPSHHLKSLRLDQLQDYGIGCGFARKRLDRWSFITCKGKAKVQPRTSYEGTEGEVEV